MRLPAEYHATLTLLFLLLSVDLAFLAIHVFHVWSPWLSGSHYSIETDRGLAEVYQYIKLFWITLCMAIVYLQTRLKTFLSWTVLFGFLLLDDAAQIHERVGFWLGARLDLPELSVLRPDDFGELLFAGFIGALTLGAVAYTLWNGEHPARRASRDILCMVGALALFGVGVDLLHVISYFSAPQSAPLLALVEDGGEMIVVSMITCYAFELVSKAGKGPLDLWSLVIKPRQAGMTANQ